MDPVIIATCGGTVLSVITSTVVVVWKLAGMSKDIRYLKTNGFSELAKKVDRCQMDKERRIKKLELADARHHPED